jgi:antiviral helicase SLH1
MTEADVLAVLSHSVEFEQLKVRESEVEDLKAMEDSVPCQVKVGLQPLFDRPLAHLAQGGSGTTPRKVNVLLQAHISRLAIHDFALISDCGYVAQNAGRIARALLDIAISRRWSSTTAVLLSLTKSIESAHMLEPRERR